MRIFLVRHGQTWFNRQKRLQGVCDSPLTELGIRQAKKLQEYFQMNNISFDQAYSSTQERASDTLELLTDMPYTRLKGLKERSYGHWEGRSSRLFPLPWLKVSPAVETRKHAADRVEKTLLEITSNAKKDDTILVVGHGDSLHCFISQKVNPKFTHFKNCSTVELSYDGSSFTYKGYTWPAENLR